MIQAVSATGSGRLPVAAWDRLYGERVARSLNQAASARICQVTQQTFSGWEQGKRIPRRKSWPNLAQFLHLSDAAFVSELRTVFPNFIR